MTNIEDPRTVEDVESILVENARLLGEPQDAFLRPLADGGYRIQTKVDGKWRPGRVNRQDYTSLTQLCWAARIALSNARDLTEVRR